MEYLVRSLESQPLSRPVVLPVLDHSQFFIGHSLHAPLLGNVLTQQPIEALVAAALPAAVWIGKIGHDVQSLIDGLVICKFLSTANVLDPCAQWLEHVLDDTPHQTLMLCYAFARLKTWYRSSRLRCWYIGQLGLGGSSGHDALHPQPPITGFILVAPRT